METENRKEQENQCMKRVFNMTMACAIALTMSVNIHAIGSGQSDSAPVKGTYEPGTSGGSIYSVDITWKDLSFTYNGASQGTWNPATHQYDNSAPAGWAEGTGTITVTNHSNAAITATPSYTPKTEYNTAGIDFGVESLVLETADNGGSEAGTPTSGTISVTPTGTLPEGTSNTVIGEIKVTIS